MLKFLESTNEWAARLARLLCMIVPAAMLVRRMYSYIDTHACDPSSYAVTPVMCSLCAVFLALAGIAWSFRPSED